LGISVTGTPGGGANAVLVVGLRITMFIMACAAVYHAYEAYRSALTGTQSKVSAPTGDPTTWSNRIWSTIGGTMGFLFAALIFHMWFFRWGPWRLFYGG